ncbi:MAG: hypothetical protein ACR5LA_11535 [Wolbachia sp.]
MKVADTGIQSFCTKNVVERFRVYQLSAKSNPWIPVSSTGMTR